MTIVPCNYNSVKNEAKVKKPTANYLLLTSFIDSKLKCAEVKDFTHVDAYSCGKSLKKSAEVYNLDIEVYYKKGRVYLINNKIK